MSQWGAYIIFGLMVIAWDIVSKHVFHLSEGLAAFTTNVLIYFLVTTWGSIAVLKEDGKVVGVKRLTYLIALEACLTWFLFYLFEKGFIRFTDKFRTLNFLCGLGLAMGTGYLFIRSSEKIFGNWDSK